MTCFFFFFSPHCCPAEWNFCVSHLAFLQTVSRSRPGPRSACSSPHWSPWQRERKEQGEPKVCWVVLFFLWLHEKAKAASNQRGTKKGEMKNKGGIFSCRGGGLPKVFYLMAIHIQHWSRVCCVLQQHFKANTAEINTVKLQ